MTIIVPPRIAAIPVIIMGLSMMACTTTHAGPYPPSVYVMQQQQQQQQQLPQQQQQGMVPSYVEAPAAPFRSGERAIGGWKRSGIQTVASQNRATMLIMGEDADPDTVPRNSRVFRRVLDALGQIMNQRGVDVFDETATTMDTSEQGRMRRPDSELIAVARNNVTMNGRPLTIRTVTTFQMYISLEELPHTAMIRTRVAGRMLDVPSGRLVGTYELTDPSERIAISLNCAHSRECLLEKVGDNAREIASGVADELARLLQADRLPAAANAGRGEHNIGSDGGGQPGGSPNNTAGTEIYNLKMENFTDEEFDRLAQYLTEVFPGYVNLNSDKTTGTTRYVTYWSSLSSTQLSRDLTRALGELNWPGRVSNSGNSFTIQKSALRQPMDQAQSSGKW
jgi:hypothetical protein